MTRASTRRCPAASIARSSASRKGSELRLPQNNGMSSPRADNSALQRGEQRATLIVDRALAPEEEVVFADLGQPLTGNAPPAGDVLEERHHLLRPLGAAEGHQQDRLVRVEARSGRNGPPGRTARRVSDPSGTYLSGHSQRVILAHKEECRGCGAERLPAGARRSRGRARSPPPGWWPGCRCR